MKYSQASLGKTLMIQRKLYPKFNQMQKKIRFKNHINGESQDNSFVALAFPGWAYLTKEHLTCLR